MAPGVLQNLGMDEAGLHQLRLPDYSTVCAYDTNYPPSGRPNSLPPTFSCAKFNVLPSDVDHEVFGDECTQGEATSFPKHTSML